MAYSSNRRRTLAVDIFIQSFLLPLATGSFAGFLINWILEKSRAGERRRKVLAALQAQVDSLPRINTHNQTASDKTAPALHLLPITYPTTPFETALFSENNVSVSADTINAATDYLLKAYELNASINALQTAHFTPQHDNVKQPTRSFLFDQAQTEMTKKIEALRASIKSER